MSSTPARYPGGVRLPPVVDEAEIARIRARLLDAGAQEWELDQAQTIDELLRLSGDVGNRPLGVRTSLRSVASAAGIPLDVAAGFLRAAGLAVGDVDALEWYTSDVEWMRATREAGALFGDEAVLTLLRRAGSAMSQLSTAASSVFRVNLGNRGDLADPMTIVERNLGTRPLIDLLITVVGQLYRYHSRLSFREDSIAAGSFSEVRWLSVGFVDLASSTELGASLFGPELARAISDFNTVASDVAIRHGARLVKTIGDEVMICALDASAVCHAALDLVAYCSGHETFSSARGAVATGDVLEQEGDCYGPVVNRAARFVGAAPDATVMIDAETVETLAPDLRAEPVPAAEHRGLGVVGWYAVMRPEA
jgi:adenylate cyclase